MLPQRKKDKAYLDPQGVQCCILRHYHATVAEVLLDCDLEGRSNSLVDGVHVTLLQYNVQIHGNSGRQMFSYYDITPFNENLASDRMPAPKQ